MSTRGNETPVTDEVTGVVLQRNMLREEELSLFIFNVLFDVLGKRSMFVIFTPFLVTPIPPLLRLCCTELRCHIFGEIADDRQIFLESQLIGNC